MLIYGVSAVEPISNKKTSNNVQRRKAYEVIHIDI